jgi:hypothetical protein
VGIYWNKDGSTTEPKETPQRPAQAKRPKARIQFVPGSRTWTPAAEDDPDDPESGDGGTRQR